MNDDERFIANQKLHATVREIRGRILNSLAVIDVNISKILSVYFSPEEHKRDLLMSEVFTSQSYGLRTKVQLLKKIISNDLDFYLEDKEWFFSDLEKLRKFRNDLAHATLDVSEKAHKKAETQVGFIFYKNGKRHTKVVTFERADEYRVKANMVSDCLNDIARIYGIRI
ncbi:MAG: hypothetical protein KBT63_06340 [Porticoccaceae bacterium]|nr:hypothetical protein [Porticoccaceae bacterium]